ncbi:ATP-grasp domain-containing protein [Algoriphagus litoralis]|uniref:ATP-grasp domain-containing protein n=1 Tax=Algoriphagus litoralis TaxID=2202829 RepID=UPI000DBAA428|nr:glutathione synthetase [Algoriphagus litoralis]
MTHQIAIVSYFSIGAYDTDTVDEDRILSEVLGELGISHEIVIWSDPDVEWEKFTCLLIKSVWDYFDYYPEFLDWIERMKALKIPVWNDLETIKWNSSKEYLLEIEQRGFPVISGLILEAESAPELDLIREKIQSDTIVIKPLVSGGAKNTLKIKLSEWDNYSQKLKDLLQEEDFLVQPFIPEVAEVGEYSLLFFNGRFSHAVLKTPAKSDFRVQHYFGGTIQVITPTPEMLESCQKVMNTYAPNTLYGRVDGVEINGVFHLMELELIEPYLFLALSDDAIPNYQEALRKRLLNE